MKKLILLIIPLLLSSFFLSAQYNFLLNVQGDGWVHDRLVVGDSINENVFIGLNAGINNTAGSPNSYSGKSNTFVGADAGRYNTDGHINTFLGRWAGRSNTSGYTNTFIGSQAGRSNTSGYRNTFMGFAAGDNTTTGLENTMIGVEAGRLNITGSYNTFLGKTAGIQNTTGSANTFVGINAGRSNTTSDYNTFIGENAGQLTSTGFQNTFVGSKAGFANTLGAQNVFVGRLAGEKNTTGFANTFSGQGAGNLNTIGRNNTFLGSGAGNVNTTGGFITCIGTRSNVLNNNLMNAMAIGESAIVDADNKVVIGNTSVITIGGYANWMNLSDKRYKKKIQEENTKNHLDFILNLTPVSYQYNTAKLVKEQQTTLKKLTKSRTNQSRESLKEENKLNENKAAEIKAAQAKDKIRYTGFLAQEVEKVANEADYKDFSGVVKPDVNGGKYALRYAEFVVPLVGAMQEQQKQIAERNQRIEQLESDVTELKELLNSIIDAKKGAIQQTSIIKNASLGQNIPNPFNALTSIPYSIPQNSQKATIQIHNMAGQLLKTVSIKSFGEGTLQLQTMGFSKGQYTYTLEIDGQIIETKRMSLIK